VSADACQSLKVTYADSRVGRVSADVWLEGLIVGLGMAAVAAAAVFALVDAHPHQPAAILTSLVYPLEDVALLGVLLGIGCSTSTASSASTKASAIRRATSCSPHWPRGSRPRSLPTRSPAGSAATSSVFRATVSC